MAVIVLRKVSDCTTPGTNPWNATAVRFGLQTPLRLQAGTNDDDLGNMPGKANPYNLVPSFTFFAKVGD